jgi:RHS repeat-associated protein
LIGPAFLSRLLATAMLFTVDGVAFSNLAAQVQAPSATDVSPTVNAEVSSVVNTGSGYDAWTGSAHRQITDLEVPGAVGSHGLKWTRSYNSGNERMWSFSYTWRYWGRGWPDPQAVVLPDGGIWRPYEPGMKLRLIKSGPTANPAWADLYLEDGSMVHMEGYTDFPDDKYHATVDYLAPLYLLDPYGRKTILTYEEVTIPPYYNGYYIRLTKVTDPSGRYIKITYGLGNGTGTFDYPTRVEGSDGSWVNYTWAVQTHQTYTNYGAMVLTRVDYSNGTSANYAYGDTTYVADFVCCDQNGISYTYINDERLRTVTSTGNNYTLAYDALGRCVKRTLNSITTYYVYDGEKPVLEYNSSGAIVGRNLYGKAIDEILLRVDVINNWTLYFQQDHEGSVTHLTSSTGTVIEKYKYDAFGAPTIYNASGMQISTSTYNNRFLFTGREYAPTFGFYEYRARAYNPTLGRFMSEDPKLFDAGDYNLYRYVHNDPLDLTDPMGLDVGAAGYDASEVIRLPNGYVFEKSTVSSPAGERLRNWALSQVGSRQWLKDSAKPPLQKGDNKCNQFLRDGVKATTGDNLAIGGVRSWLSTIRHLFEGARMPSSHELADPKAQVSGATKPMPLERGMSGDLIAQQHNSEGEYGHAGIIVGRDTVVSVSSRSDPAGIVGINNWGFRPRGENAEARNDPPPVVRKLRQ